MRLDLVALRAAYDGGRQTPDRMLPALRNDILAAGALPVWLALLDEAGLARRLQRLARRRAAGETLPLYGIPFAVKDNIDVAGLPTTAACPAFARRPEHSARVVERLEAAGAIPLGKTNLDQFATGLVGTRSPYGAPSSVFDPATISGGSSSGSAVAVAAGQVSFALGSDTAGSGRVPAAFNNIVGLKPSRGLLSSRGLLPACRSLDVISIFAGCVDDAEAVLGVAAGFDPLDPYSRRCSFEIAFSGAFRFGVPAGPLEFYGDRESEQLYHAALARLTALGGQSVPFDFAPFAATAALLYRGPFVAERLAALNQAGFTDWASMDPVVAGIIRGAENLTAVQAFEGLYDLAAFRRAAEPAWQSFDFMLLPTAPTIFTHAEIAEQPVARNAQLGLYTNFVNLMDLAAIAVPAGFRADGRPFGVSLIGPAFSDRALAAVADRLHRSLEQPRWGGSAAGLPPARPRLAAESPVRIRVAVVGAHLSGQPLNGQLTERRARLIGTCRTAAGYKLYALADSSPPKPGLVRDEVGGGLIEIEIWEMEAAAFGSFVANVPPPLAIGTLRLQDGSTVKGFLCEAAAIKGARDITHTGGWRAYLATMA